MGFGGSRGGPGDGPANACPQTTRIGVAVNSVRKHCSDEEVVASAKILIKNWKRLLGERGKILPKTSPNPAPGCPGVPGLCRDPAPSRRDPRCPEEGEGRRRGEGEEGEGEEAGFPQLSQRRGEPPPGQTPQNPRQAQGEAQGAVRGQRGGTNGARTSSDPPGSIPKGLV